MRNNHKKGRFILCLLLALSAPLTAGETGSIYTVTNLGFEPLTRYEDETGGTGFSLGQELYISLGKSIQTGIGAQYLFPREIADEGRLSWQPIFAAVKFFVPQQNIPLYLKGCAGYAFIQGDSDFRDGKTDMEGGLYYLFGGGVDLPVYYSDSVRFSLIFDMGYASFSASLKQNGAGETISFKTLDMNAGIGLRF